MFLAMGVGAFSAGIFHVMTHAFFKALLFLGAGSVIHGMHDEQNIQKYGGLKKYMPTTYKTFLVAAIAISGIPPLSGFFSKDEILWSAYANAGFMYWFVGVVTSLLTAFYMFRLLNLTFEGKHRFDEHHVHPHESPKLMTVPLIVLAALSVIGGFIGIPEIFSGEHGNKFHGWLEPIFSNAQIRLAHYGSHTHFEEILLMVLSVVGAAGSIYFARHIYLKDQKIAENTAAKYKGIYKILLNKYYVDEAYNKMVVQPIFKTSESLLWKITDSKLIDGLVNGAAALIEFVSGKVRKIQTGVAQTYAIVMMLGLAASLFWIIFSL